MLSYSFFWGYLGLNMGVVNNNLDSWQKMAVAAAMVMRMSANYELFDEITQSNNARKFNGILALVWEFLAGDNQAIDFEKQQNKLEQIIPNPEDFDFYGVWPAMDATTGLMVLLEACQNTGITDEDFNSVLRLSQSTIEAYGGFREDEQVTEVLLCAEQAFI